ncbi:Uma2 family endonuclease [Dendronalium sp. ChiSLP03b]|uniref:Uma2 family endonuclease n=1 Tax=Dendronalium sp. ChiSLP03b TaxID=3075381 RepID=UPI002AD58B94|nr:Uma2 family endonuclease [Dendronalium sp. ChiSLP03b]MDZ8204991.1 Uma2 family endonuclease [Dendronalium sp. ChiSLP03b]
MSEIQTQLLTDTWVTATWDEYVQVIENPAYEKAKGYYHNQHMRIEMPPVGNDHASDHTIILFAVNLFASIKGIALNGKDNCTYRKAGLREAQPDVSYYIGENTDVIPYGTSIINLDIYPPPNLAIEVANTSLADDKGEKRLLYEDLGVAEYWIVDVQKVQVIAFAVENGGSRRITESLVLPGLAISLLNEALRRTRQINQSQVGAWLLTEFQK